MSFMLYIIGFIVFIAGLAWLATVMGVSQTYIMIGAVILLGIGLFTAATRTRAKDPPST
jgi:positive regulator of sigma E activity